MPGLVQSPQPLMILVGGHKQHSTSKYFHGHISCVLFFDSALELHVIKAFQLCPNRHGKSNFLIVYKPSSDIYASKD